MANFCSKCGAKLDGNEKFCSNCGNQLEEHSIVGLQEGVHDEEPEARCPYCGKGISRGASRCIHCGFWLDGSHINDPKSFVNPYAEPQPQIIIKNYTKRTNGFGVTGFIFAILAIITSFMPGINLSATPILATLGLLFSFIGLFFPSKGLAIIGFILSILPFVLLALIGGVIYSFTGQ